MKKKQINTVICTAACIGMMTCLLSCRGAGSSASEPSVTNPTEERTPSEDESKEPESNSEEESNPGTQSVVQTILFTPPEGFEEEAVDSRVLYSPDYETDHSFISVSRLNSDVSIFLMNQDSYAQYLSEVYQKELDIKPSIVIENQTIMTIDGLAALYCKYTVSQDGQEYYQVMEYTIQADYNYQVIFADGSDGYQWEKAFTESAKTISAILKETPSIGEDLYRDLTWYESDDFRIAMIPDMELEEDASSLITYTKKEQSIVLSVNRELFSDLEEKLPSDSSVEEYAAFALKGSGAEDSLETDYYGNLSVIYMRSSGEEKDTVYYIVFRKEKDGFWTFQFSCPEDQSETYLEQFALWASSIQF